MKPSLPTLLSILLFAFPLLAFTSNAAEQVLDANGLPLIPGRKYYILPAIRGPPGGGVRLGQTGNSECPVTVLQEYSEVLNGAPVKFFIKGTGIPEIFTGTPLEIRFNKRPKCTKSSKWMVFVDETIKKACVGIGGPEDHPGQQTFNGTFKIEKYVLNYKLIFCIDGTPTCLDIGRYDNGEGGRRLNLTEHEAFEIVFVDAENFDTGMIKSVV